MNKSPSANDFLTRLLHRTGQWYIVVVVALAQLIAFPGAALGALIIQLNADFTPEQLRASVLLVAATIAFGNVLLLGGVLLLTRQARQLIDRWKSGRASGTSPAEELRAWREITALSWRYAVAGLIISALVDVLPLLVYQYTALDATFDQLVYTLFGGVISALGIIILSSLLIERALLPARRLLLPAQFQPQLSGAAGLRMFPKFQSIIIAIIALSILLVAPIGYHQTYRVLYSEIGSGQVLVELQVQSILVSLLALASGTGLSFLLARSLSDPIRAMIDVFNKVEQGDVSQRAPVEATDEVGELTIYFNRMVSRLDELQQNLERQVQERTRELRATVDVGRIASSILEPDTLMNQVANLISERFGHYYTAIFLLDDSGGWAELKEATGEAGRVLKAQRHRLRIGGKSMVGSAISGRKARIALDVGLEAVRFDNPLLPETRSEIALPLLVGERVLGAMDVQSKKSSAFGEQDIEILQNMANQVAIALENARLFQETRESLEEVRTLYSQYVTNAWSDKLRVSALDYETGAAAAKEGEAVTIQVPLTLRDQVIGAIELDTNGEWTADDQSWVESIATQVAISLENARLIEESQQAALRERLAASITEKIWSAPTIDGILQTAVREIGRALDAHEATIELKLDKSGSGNANRPK